jgi:hypothetical protein
MLELIDQYRRVALDKEAGIGSDGVTGREVVEINDLAVDGSGESCKKGRLPNGTWAVQDDGSLLTAPKNRVPSGRRDRPLRMVR